MEFTKEQIETAKKILESYRVVQNRHHNFENYLDSLLKPETKLIDVRIECDKNADVDIYLRNNNSLPSWLNDIKYKATELPEVFTREEVKLFTKYCIDNGWIHLEKALDNWLDERKSNE